MVGDRVSVEGENSRRLGTITEMTDNSRLHSMFTGQTMEDSVRSYTYTIKMDDNEETVTKYKASELQRDRKVYSKLILKQFLRNAMTRESWVGAPWKVKDSLAKRYDISTKIPDHKTRDAVLAQKKALQNSQLNGNSPPAQQPYPPQAPNGHGPHVNGQRPHLPAPGQGQSAFVNFTASGPPPYLHRRGSPPPYLQQRGPLLPFLSIHPPYIGNAPPGWHSGSLPAPPVAYPPQFGGPLPPHLAHILHHNTRPVNLPFQTSFPHHQGPQLSNPPQSQQQPQQLARPFEPAKYPCEDLEIRLPRLVCERPALNFSWWFRSRGTCLRYQLLRL